MMGQVMPHTITHLLKFAKHGVIATSTLRQLNAPLLTVLESNREALSQNLKLEHGVYVLWDHKHGPKGDDQVRLLLKYYYGSNVKLRDVSKGDYNIVYYRAKKKNMTVEEYLEDLGFKPVDDHDFVHLIDTQKYSVREVSAMTGVPKSTVHRKYKQQKEEVHS